MHPVIAADKGSQRDRLWSAEGRIPTGAMLYRGHRLSVLAPAFVYCAMPNQLLSGLRVPSIEETGKLLSSNGTGKAELEGQLAVPLALNGVALFPIVLFGGELFGVVGLRVARGERFGNSEHGRCLNPADKILRFVRNGKDGSFRF
jgi:hypothetical protein